MADVYLPESHDTNVCECGRRKPITHRRCKPCRQKEYRGTNAEQIRRKDRIRQKKTAVPIARVMPISRRVRVEALGVLSVRSGSLPQIPKEARAGQPGPWGFINVHRSFADNRGVADAFTAERFGIAPRRIKELGERCSSSAEQVKANYLRDAMHEAIQPELEARTAVERFNLLYLGY